MLPGEKEISERFNKKTEWRENRDETLLEEVPSDDVGEGRG